MSDPMILEQALESLRLKFTSGNSIPVERASVTHAEYEAIHKTLRAYADSIERSQKGVTKEVEERAYKAFCRAGNRVTRGTEQDCLRAALLAVWPSVTEPVIADAEDAARYRHLRDDNHNFAVFMPREHGHIAFLGKALDAKIDAARAAEGGA